jgi:hypothetical protein
MDFDWKKIDADHEQQFEKDMDAAKKRNAADRDFFGAAQLARRSTKLDELLPIRNEYGDFEYTQQQAFKAACHGREDAAATLQLQRALLVRLDRNRTLLWLAIGLLAFIAYRLS